MRILRPPQISILLLTLIGLSSLTISCTSPDSDLIPREILFGNPVKTKPKISPDGKMMAYLAPLDNVLNVWVRDIDRKNDQPVTRDTNRGIRWYFWAHDNKHIIYDQDVGGDENWRLYSVNLETGEIGDLTPFENVQVRVIDLNKNFPDELLIAMNKDDIRYHDVYRLNLTTGEIKMAAKNNGRVLRWVIDSDFKVRGALYTTKEGGSGLMIRENEKSKWRKLVSWDYENSLSSGPVNFSKDGKYIYLVDSRDVNANRLIKMNIATGLFDVIAEDPQYDISNALIHPDTYEIQMVAFNRERQEWIVLDESIRDDIAIIRSLHDGDFFIYNRNDADDMWLLGFTADDGPIPYYAYDRNKKTATLLFYRRPELNKYKLSPMEPISFTSRDGLTIHGYITYPPGDIKTNLPMVLKVHGGPYTRDSWGFDTEVQWFANRGYVCLQVNFRGSHGYGKNFLNAGDREWGGKMHDDLIDGVNWAIEQGIADSQRVAIYGYSFGGYAALVGATFTPDVFCCAVDIVGASNLITWIKTVPHYWAAWKSILYKRVGHPETDREFLESRSPLFKVDSIKSPLLIAHGANDSRVKLAESEQIVEAMKKKGIEYEFMLFKDEGHGFAKPENKLKFYAAAEKFLARHMGGRYEK